MGTILNVTNIQLLLCSKRVTTGDSFLLPDLGSVAVFDGELVVFSELSW